MLDIQSIIARKKALANTSATCVPLEPSIIPVHAYSNQTVRNAVSSATLHLLMDNIHAQTLPYYEILLKAGWQFVLANQSRGWCQSATKTITYPMWLLKKSKAYQQWYIAHEIAHAFAGWQAKHGLIFMDWLKKVCPDASIHFEITYKPRNATRAGIFDFTDL